MYTLAREFQDAWDDDDECMPAMETKSLQRTCQDFVLFKVLFTARCT